MAQKKAPTNPPKQATSRVRAKKTVPRLGTTRPGKPNNVAWHDPFIASLTEIPNVAAACRAVGIGSCTAYEHRQKFPDFAERWAEAEEMGVQNVRGMAFRLATIGAARKKFDKSGMPILDPETGKQYIEYEISERMIELLLKSHLPEVYGDKSKVEVTTPPLTEEEALTAAAKAEISLLLTIQASALNRLKGKSAGE